MSNEGCTNIITLHWWASILVALIYRCIFLCSFNSLGVIYRFIQHVTCTKYLWFVWIFLKIGTWEQYRILRFILNWLRLRFQLRCKIFIARIWYSYSGGEWANAHIHTHKHKHPAIIYNVHIFTEQTYTIQPKWNDIP